MSDGDRAGTAMLEQPESPFLGFTETSAEVNQPAVPLALVESPFLMEYQLGDEVVDREASGIRELLEDLYDAEFDETLDELLEEAERRLDRLGPTRPRPAPPAGSGCSTAGSSRSGWKRSHVRSAWRGLDGEELTRWPMKSWKGSWIASSRGTRACPRSWRTSWEALEEGEEGRFQRGQLVKKGVAAATKLLPIGTLLRR